MKYLAFDIEAANGYKPYSICSIGIIKADEELNIFEQRNIWINPKTKYDLNGTRQNVGINLHLDVDLINQSPDFSQVYDEVCKLLTDEDYLVVGHAVESDVYMINAACKHYGLPSINFKFICSQLLFKLFTNAKEVRALNKIAEEIEVEFNFHSSDEDAKVSMLTLKYLSQQLQLSVSQMLEKYNIRIGENKDFVMTRTLSLTENLPKKKKRPYYHYAKKTPSCNQIDTQNNTTIIQDVNLYNENESDICKNKNVDEFIDGNDHKNVDN